MNKTLKILPILLLVIGCTTDENGGDVAKINLVEGTYYLNFKLSNDTLRFQSEIYDKGNWNNTIWRITEDLIFQEDSRGLSYYFGKDQRKYILSNDTLFIWTNLQNEKVGTKKNEVENPEQYLLLKSDKKQLEIIDLNKTMIIDKSNEIRSDIQLR